MQTSVLRAPATQSVLPRNTAAAVPRHVARAAGSHGSRHHKQHVGTLKSSSDLSWSSSNPARQVATAAAPGHVAAAASTAATSSSSFRDCAVTLATVADATKALDVSVLHVEPIVNYTSYLVLCTVMSKPQLMAVLLRMEDAAAEYGLEKQNSVGSSQWEVLDFGSIVVHVFTAEQRDYYNLDDFYALAEEVELPFVSETAAVTPGGFEQQQYAQDGADSSMGGLWTKSL